MASVRTDDELRCATTVLAAGGGFACLGRFSRAVRHSSAMSIGAPAALAIGTFKAIPQTHGRRHWTHSQKTVTANSPEEKPNGVPCRELRMAALSAPCRLCLMADH